MIEEANLEVLDDVVKLSLKLWPEHTYEEMSVEFSGYISKHESAVFVAKVDGVVGFAQVGLRHDYVEGTESSPVGYLEGIYVEKDYRKQGIASALVKSCERWAKSLGCTEFASDIEMENKESFEFHMKYGFEEANRLICFKKSL